MLTQMHKKTIQNDKEMKTEKGDHYIFPITGKNTGNNLNDYPKGIK